MSSRKSNVFLIGPMGSGKTAVGKHLARLMRAPFRDSDAEIESRTGVDISYIFSREGEAGFRQREREVIEDVTRESPIVLATGGGAILLEANRKVLHERGFVVYLRTSLEQQVERVRQGAIARCCTMSIRSPSSPSSWPCASRSTSHWPTSASRPTGARCTWWPIRYSRPSRRRRHAP